MRDNYPLSSFGENYSLYYTKLSKTNEQITIIEKTTNLLKQSSEKKMNIENMVEKAY
jgi:N-glycosylase/DNA lyase